MGQVNRSLDLDEILRTSLEGIQQVVGGGFGCFLLLEPEKKTLKLAQPVGLGPVLTQELERLAHDCSPIFLAPSSQDVNVLALLGERIRVALKATSFESVILIPLTARAQPIGILIMGIGTGRLLMPPSVDLLMSMGEQIGMAIEHARLMESVRKSEEWHRLFIEQNLDGFWETSADQKIRYVNPAGCAMLGYTREELIGAPPVILWPDVDKAQAMGRKIRSEGILQNEIAELRTKDGTVKTISMTSRAVFDSEGKMVGFQTVARDVTEQQKTMQELSHRNLELNALNAISEILSHPFEIAPALDQVCEQISSITGMEAVTLHLRDESAPRLNLAACRGIPHALLVDIQQLGLDDPVTRMIAVNGEPLALDDMMAAELPGLAGPRAFGYRAGIGVPIKVRQQPMGALFIGSQTRLSYGRSDVALLTNIAQRIGMALENAHLYAQMQRRVRELDGLARLSAACTSSLDPGKICDIAVEWTQELLDAEMSSFRVPEGDMLRLAASRTMQPLALVEQIPLDSVFRPIIQAHQTFVVNDVQLDTRMPSDHRAKFLALGMRALLFVPVLARGRAVGALMIGRTKAHDWSDAEISLLQTIANQTANALANAQLFQAVLDEQRKMQAIFQSSLSGLLVTDAEGKILMFNRAAERITGWKLSEAQGKKWEEIFEDASPNESVEPLIYEALYRKQPAYVPDGRKIKTRDGRIIPVAKAVAPLLDENEGVVGAVGAFWDLSREQAGEISRASFLQMTAHQLRNPLTALILALELLDNPRLPAARRNEMESVVKSQAARLRKFSQQFLDHEAATRSPRPVRCERLAIGRLTRGIVDEFKATALRHSFECQIPEPEPVVYADADRVGDILRNLLDNAVNYAPERTPIRIIVGVMERENLVDVAVCDQGPGIKPEEQEHVFDMFYRAHRTTRGRAYGHGLGLHIARTLAQDMDGTIQLECPSEGGSIFHLLLRRSQ